MSTTTPPIEKIPLEILHHIVSFLPRNPRDSLHSLSLTNKNCLCAADTSLFSIITIQVLGRKKLQRDVQKWHSILARSQSFKHVRKLNITGYMPPEQEDIGDVDMTTQEAKKRFLHSDHAEELLPDPETEAAAWRPLVPFFISLQALAKLNFRTANQIPRIVLDALHTKLPHSCKLTMSKFRFRSLHEGVIDPHEYALITSPRLVLIKAEITRLDIPGENDNDIEVLKRFMLGLAPALENLTVQANRVWPRRQIQALPRSPPSILRANLPLLSVNQLLERIAHQRDQGSRLSRLSFMFLVPSEIAPMIEHLDSCRVRNLNIYSTSVQTTSQQEMWFQTMANNKLESLSHLTLHIGNMPPSESFRRLVSSFFLKLRPLKYLNLSIPDQSKVIKDGLIRRHGPSLQYLCLGCVSPHEPGADLELIQQFQEHCHSLESLDLQIQRSQGDAEEVEKYRILGCLPNLQKLEIQLKPAAARSLNSPVDPIFNDFEQQIYVYAHSCRNGDIRNTFISQALDESLVRSIHDIMTSAKSRAAVPLQLIVQGRLYWPGPGTHDPSPLRDFKMIERFISTSWEAKHESFWDQETSAPRTRVIVQPRARDAEGRSQYQLPDVLHPDLEAIFRSVWPRRENDTGNWKEDWYSFPLAST